MALSDRAAVVAPYAQRLLYDRQVQDALGRVFDATRGAYSRGRRRNARQAVTDQKLRRQLQQALNAVCDLRSALNAPAPRRKTRRVRSKVALVAMVGTGGFFALNAGARERVLALVGKNGGQTEPQT
jgi:hypothetical protein